MARRKKLTSHWPPAGWKVQFEWEWNGKPLQSRKHDVQVKVSERKKEWIQFDYWCHNTNNDKIWVSGFDGSGFTAYRPEQIVSCRAHKKRKSVTNVRATRSDKGKSRK